MSQDQPDNQEVPLHGTFEMGAPLPPGFPFDADSVLRRVVSEPATLSITQLALVEEVAHPKVAAAVNEHSVVRERPINRYLATGGAVLRIIYGTPEEAKATVQHIYDVHDNINGVLPEAGGPWQQGERYDAHEASSLLWVWGTLVDTLKIPQERYVAPLTPEQNSGYYHNMITTARLLGIPNELIPPTFEDFRTYFDDMLESGTLGSTPTSRDMVDMILNLKGMVPAPVARLARGITLTNMDPRLRESLGVQLHTKEQASAERVDRMMRNHYKRLPEARRALPDLLMKVVRYSDKRQTRRTMSQLAASNDSHP